MAPKQWVPLESNPDVLTRFGHALGLPSSLSFTDVWGLDLLDIVPAPRHAVLLLFPLTPRINERSATLEVDADDTDIPFFCKQTISNACGTIALLHAALNAPTELEPASFLHAFRKRTEAMTPDQRAAALHEDTQLDEVHGTFAQEGQTPVPHDLNNLDMHFVCFVHHNGKLFQLDGRRSRAVAHGATTPDTLLQDAAKAIRADFMEIEPAEHRFTIVALTAKPLE